VRFAQRFRTPVTVLADQTVGQMREGLSPEAVPQYRLAGGDFDLTPGDVHLDPVAEVRRRDVLGTKSHLHVTGLSHDATGFPTNDPGKAGESLRVLCDKADQHHDELCLYDTMNEGKGRVCIVAYGSCARSARAACRLAGREGLPVEVLQLYTLFPQPADLIEQVAKRVDFMLVPESNLGQYADEVRRMAGRWTTVVGMCKADGALFTPREILDRICGLIGENGKA
jgi:2-oxoglutarate/2-oxoacid ferredoxin oxidoreductase subunit alpha